jgi:outer membrane protein, adhesin transport system
LAVLLCMQVQPLHAESLTLSVQRALKNYPEIAALSAYSKAARAKADFSSSLSLPTVSLGLNGGLDAKRNSGTSTLIYPLSLSLNAALPVYDGGSASAEKRRSRSSLAAANQRLSDSMNTIGLQTVQNYVEVLRLRAVHKILEHNIAVIGSIARKIELRVDGGFGNEADIYEARSSLEAAKLQLLEVEQQQIETATNFRLLVGIEPTKLEPISMPTKALPASVETAVALARSRSPKILAVRYDAISAEADVDNSLALSRPKINLVLGLDQNSFLDQLKDNTGSYDLSAKINFSLSLYDGGANRSRVNQALAVSEASRFTASTTALDVEREIRTAWNAVKTSGQKIEPLKRQFENAQKSLSINLKRFDAGLTTLEKVMNVQSQITSAELALLNEQVIARYNVFRILGGTGQLISALGIEPTEPRLEP